MNQNPIIHELLGTHEEAHNLFKSDPEEFERRRKEIIKEAIDKAPEHLKQSLIRTMHSYETKTRKIKDPVVKASIASGLMNDSLFRLNNEFNGMKASTNNLIKDMDTISETKINSTSGNVIPLKQKPRNDKLIE